jgi:hypothetical protein
VKNELSRSLPPLKALVSFTDDQLARIDVALLNLVCACGLPGAEDIDLFALLSKLDDWSDEAKHQIQRQWYQFLANPADYENSPGYFCILVLITVLQRDLGVRYNPERVKDPKFQDPYCVNPDFRDSRDLFIHGILDGPGGTCSSMPVLYTAASRRLGFPVFLVEAKNHSYCRWDGDGERFNIEGSGQGFGTYPDSHYEEWPLPLTDFDRKSGAYGRCLTPREELASFLTTRGHCLLDNGRRDEAIECFRWSVDLAPHDKRYQAQLDSILNPNRGRLFISSHNPYQAGTVVEVPCGSLPPADLPWGVPIRYVRASGGGGLPGRQPKPGQPVKIAAGQPLPTCLPPGTPMQVVPADQADDLSAFEAAAKRPQSMPQIDRPPQPAVNYGMPGIGGPLRGLPGS